MFALEGVPAVYFNSLFATSNDEQKYIITGNNRDINRYKWNKKNILNLLKNKDSKQSYFYNTITELLDIRKKQKAFHPNSLRTNINLGSQIFCFKRVSLDKKQTIISITNLTSKSRFPKLSKRYILWKNLINPKNKIIKKKSLKLRPFETMWLTNI